MPLEGPVTAQDWRRPWHSSRCWSAWPASASSSTFAGESRVSDHVYSFKLIMHISFIEVSSVSLKLIMHISFIEVPSVSFKLIMHISFIEVS